MCCFVVVDIAAAVVVDDDNVVVVVFQSREGWPDFFGPMAAVPCPFVAYGCPNSACAVSSMRECSSTAKRAVPIVCIYADG